MVVSVRQQLQKGFPYKKLCISNMKGEKFYMSYINISTDLWEAMPYKSLSSDAKMLYIVLTQRASISEKNGAKWRTKKGEVFVYFTQKNAMLLLHCGHDKATRVFRELEDVKLIRRIPQGLGKPCRVIVNLMLRHEKKTESGVRKTSGLEGEISVSNNNNINNTDNIISSPGDISQLHEEIKEQIFFNTLKNEINIFFLETVVSIMTETITSKKRTIRIGGEEKTIDDVRSRFLHLNDLHVRNTYEAYIQSDQNIRNLRSYLLTVLYHSFWSVQC